MFQLNTNDFVKKIKNRELKKPVHVIELVYPSSFIPLNLIKDLLFYNFYKTYGIQPKMHWIASKKTKFSHNLEYLTRFDHQEVRAVLFFELNTPELLTNAEIFTLEKTFAEEYASISFVSSPHCAVNDCLEKLKKLSDTKKLISWLVDNELNLGSFLNSEFHAAETVIDTNIHSIEMFIDTIGFKSLNKQTNIS